MSKRKAKLWLSKNIEHNNIAVRDWNPMTYSTDEYILLADPIEVEFDLYDRDKTVEAEIKVLEKSAETIRAELTLAVNTITGRIQELKALPPVEES